MQIQLLIMGQWDLVIMSIKESDMVLEVIDARVARETRSIKLEELVERMGKKLIIVINKTDLVPDDFEKKIRAELKCEHEVVSVSARGRKGTGYLKGAIKKYYPKLVCVVGYPNCGKSSIINMLAHSSGAKTSSVPGYTKHAQWIRLSKETKLLDTPGVVPSDEKFSVFTGSVRPEKLKVAELAAARLLVKIKDGEGTNIEELYKVPLEDVDEFLPALALKRNYLMKGGVDVERAARQVIRDWNTGKLTAWWYDDGRDKDV